MSALEFTVPVWAALLAALLLGERITGPRLVAIVFGLVGMLIILRPGAAAIHPAALAVMAGAAGYALSHVLTRLLALSDPPSHPRLLHDPGAAPGGVAVGAAWWARVAGAVRPAVAIGGRDDCAQRPLLHGPSPRARQGHGG